MSIKVSLNTTAGNRVSVNKQGRPRVRTVALAPSQDFEDLLDVDSSDADEDETIVYDATTN